METTTMEVKLLSTKMIKPSSPTPSHLRTLNLSSLDLLFAPELDFASVSRPCVILYYTADQTSIIIRPADHLQDLETSLSETLTGFYPLAGRYMKDSHSIDCNDEGVEYLEAKVEGRLSQVILSRKDEMIDQLSHLAGGESMGPLASVQITRFDCGGLVVGFRLAHVLGDAFTMASFVSSWATACREGTGKLICPTFDLTSFFPENDLPAMKRWPSLKNVRPDEMVTRRFVLDGAKISSLKARGHDPAAAGSSLRQPSQVEAVTALIWRALMGVSQAKHGRIRTSVATHSKNLRPNIIPPLPPMLCGNLISTVTATFAIDGNTEEVPDLKCLVGLLRDSFTKSKAAVIPREDVCLSVIESRNEILEVLEKEDVDLMKFVSWCRFPFCESDFGLGKPCWVSIISSPIKGFMLLDGEGGDGIEAWVSLNKSDMLHFQQDHHLMDHHFDILSI